jgi:hypothetical protein
MWPYQQFTIQDHNRARDEQKKAQQLPCTVLVPADKEKTDKTGGQGIKQTAQDDQTIISCPLKYFVNNNLK